MIARRNLLGALLGGGPLYFAWQRRARASLALHMDIEALTTEAQSIVVARVVAVKSDWEPGHKRIVTTVDLLVDEAWKGTAASGQKVQVEQPGGTAGDIEMKVHGLPQFSVGQRAVLFLRPRFSPAPGVEASLREPLTVVGMAQGKRDLFRDPTAGKWMVHPPSRDGVISRRPDGRFDIPPAEPDTLSLDDLRSQVRTLVKKTQIK